ncbi:MAG: DoxX family protein [Kordiimonadaceae bacterium]|jgi:putative oxidoreductase|nr:DoxX family protein [Kordiimonadaceae bacterium]
MDNFLKRYEEHAYALLRMVTGFLFLFHGSRWLLGWPGEVAEGGGAWYMMYIGAPILLIGGIMVFIGLYSRYGAFLGSGMMAWAYWMVYAPRDMLPYINKGELAVMFCFALLYISTRGDGIWSIGSMRKKSD